MAYYIKTGDRLPVISATLKSNGTAVDLTNATSVNFAYRLAGATTTTTVAATIVSATAGTVKYAWGVGTTLVPGEYEAEWVVTWSGGEEQTFPSRGYMTFYIDPGL